MTSRYSLQAYDASRAPLPYAIGKALLPDAAGNPTRARYSAWHGPALADSPRGYFPALLGSFDTPAAAKAACAAHASERPAP